MTEKKRSDAAGKSDEIFLSPRVVDRQAFNEFALQLRALIDEAAAGAEALRSAAADAQRTRDGLRDAINANQMKLDMAARALAAIDQKAEQTRTMIENASDAASRIEQLRTQADSIIAERTGILCQRANEVEQAVVGQVDQAAARLEESLRLANDRASSVTDGAAGQLLAELSDIVSRAEAIAHGDAGLASIVARAEAVGQTAISATSALEEVHRQADRARHELGDAVRSAEPIIDEVGTVQGHLEATITEAVRLCQNAQKNVADHVSRHIAQIEEDATRLAPLSERARLELIALLESAADARQAAMAATTSAEQATRELTTVLGRAESWRRANLVEQCWAPDGLGGGVEGAGAIVELKKELQGVAGMLREIADRTENALKPAGAGAPGPVATITTADAAA